MSTKFWKFIEQKQSFVLVKDISIPEGVSGEFSKLESYNSAVAIPLSVGNEFYGVMLMGEKSGEYFPTTEELYHIKGLANQIAVSLYNSLLLDKALDQVQKEKRLRNVAGLIIRKQNQVLEQARFNVSEALHNDVVQHLV